NFKNPINLFERNLRQWKELRNPENFDRRLEANHLKIPEILVPKVYAFLISKMTKPLEPLSSGMIMCLVSKCSGLQTPLIREIGFLLAYRKKANLNISWEHFKPRLIFKLSS